MSGDAPELRPQIRLLEARARELQQEIFADLTAWQKVQLSRHPARPHTQDYVDRLVEGFIELHGDRHFADDQSILGGLARFNGNACLVIGHPKGRDTKERALRNFGMGAQILKDLRVKKMRLLAQPRRMSSMAGFGLEVTGYLNPGEK